MFYLLFYLANAPSYIARRLLIQRGSPDGLRGRVSSAFMVTRDLGMLLGMLGGGLADVLPIRGLYRTIGAVLLTVALLVCFLPGLRWPAPGGTRLSAPLRRP